VLEKEKLENCGVDAAQKSKMVILLSSLQNGSTRILKMLESLLINILKGERST
jgi:hypothetical protein